jgi:hypothetical protein
MTLGEADLAVFREFFAGPESVALLVTPRMMEASAAVCWVWESGAVREAGRLDWRPQPRYPASRHADAAPAPPRQLRDVPLPSFLSEPAPGESRVRLPWPRWYSWWVQAPLLFVLLVADSSLGYFAARRLTEKARPGAAALDPYALSLVVLQYGDNLHLSWNRDAAPITIARAAKLVISDGTFSRTLELTPTQLREGSVIYRRLTPDVSLKLEVFVGRTGSVSESWRLGPSGT